MTMEAIDFLEIAIRTQLNEHFVKKYNDIFWYKNPVYFVNSHEHKKFLLIVSNEFNNSKQEFAKHYRKKYPNSPFPPGWMLIEVCTVGTWSHLYRNFENEHAKNKSEIAQIFNLNKKVFYSWLLALNSLRNICAHHGRLWNNVFGVKPLIPKVLKNTFNSSTNRYSAMAMMIQHSMSNINPKNDWGKRLITLLTTLPTHRQFNMGFKNGWKKDTFWHN